MHHLESPAVHDTLLVEQQRLERTIGRARWGAVALAVLLGPSFPNLSVPGVVALGLAVAVYNVLVLRASGLARSYEQHARVTHVAFALDLFALAVAMLLFSVDPYWTTFFISTLVIIGGAFRFGSSGAHVAALATGAAYLGISIFRARAFDLALEPQRIAFHLSVFALTAFLIGRVLRDDRAMRADREALIRQLERRVREDQAVGNALRIVAGGPTAEVVPAVLEASREVLHFDRATVFAVDEEADEYRVVHRLVASPDAPPTPRMRLGEGLVGAAFATGEPLLVRNALDDPRYVPRPEGEQPRSIITVPLMVGGRPVAALSLSRALPNAFGEEDLRLAGTVAGFIAQVLENERLFVEASEARALRELDRLKDEFLAAVSHELRTPLTVISGSLELLGREADRLGERSRRLIEQASRHVERLNRNVEDLLDLAQLQEAKIALSREFVPASALLGEIALTYEPLAAARGQRIAVVCPTDLPPVLVDRRRMQQVIGNLVSNAIRYGPERSRIELRGELLDDEVLFKVLDEGPGIPEGERERVFEKFYRSDRTKDVARGTGLGLAIARTLVELHGGRVWAEGPPQSSSTFIVAIRAEPAAVEVAVR